MKAPRGGHVALGLALAMGHLAISITLVLWTLDESISRQKRWPHPPPSLREQTVDAILIATHPLTAIGQTISEHVGRSLPLPLLFVGVGADSLLWGFVSIWLIRWLRRTFWPATTNAP